MQHKTIYRPFGAFRFLLALMVMIQHGGVHLLKPSVHRFFFDMGFGIIAVAVFFVISGFVVAEANSVFYRQRPGKFLLNRVLRLAPPYLGALTIEIASAAYLYHIGKFAPWDYQLVGSPLQPSLLWGGILGLVPGFHSELLSGQPFEFFAFVWTLRIEFAFYLAAAAVYVVGISRLSPAWLRRHYCELGLAGGYALFAISMLRPSTPAQLDLPPFFLLGIAFYLVWQRRSNARLIFGAFAVGCVLLAFSRMRQFDNPVVAYQLPVLLVLLAAFAALVFADVSKGWKRLDNALGNLSYPLYLNHYVVLLTVSNLFPDQAGVPLYLAAMVASVMLAYAMHYLIETPMKQLRDSVRGTRL